MQQEWEQMELNLGLPCGRMFQEPLVQTKAKTSGPSSKSSSKSNTRQPRCLRLTENGLTQTLSWQMDSALLTEFSTLNTGESPNEERESTLSQILMENAPEKYYLSAKACEGILRRAERRGKQLPEMLKAALEQQIERMA